jgi:hypothetical protein
MPMLKFLNGDLYSIDKTPITLSEVVSHLTKDALLTSENVLILIDSDTQQTLRKPDEVLDDKLYHVLIEERFIHEWIDIDKLDMLNLSALECAFPYLKANPSKIDWDGLCLNPHPEAILMIEERIKKGHKVNWIRLSMNKSAIGLLRSNLEKANLQKVNWRHAVEYNPHPDIIPLAEEVVGRGLVESVAEHGDIACFADPDALKHIKSYFNFIGDNHYSMFLNPSPNLYTAVPEQFFELYIKTCADMVKSGWRLVSFMKIFKTSNPLVFNKLVENKDVLAYCIGTLGRNPLFVPYMKAHPNSIDYDGLLVSNESEEAMELVSEGLENNPDIINPKGWRILSTNPYAVSLLEKYQEKISWGDLSTNPKALELLRSNPDKIDYNKLSKNPCIFLSKEGCLWQP